MDHTTSTQVEIESHKRYPKVAGHTLVQIKKQGFQVEFAGQNGRLISLYRIVHPVTGEETFVEWGG